MALLLDSGSGLVGEFGWCGQNTEILRCAQNDGVLRVVARVGVVVARENSGSSASFGWCEQNTEILRYAQNDGVLRVEAMRGDFGGADEIRRSFAALRMRYIKSSG